ncbi:hypothetical protein T492DRAFT_58028 [Pavlovales sp. CCMP2436]|nr:hypothetical protein T492DRAFT_58028 [Pavlovales sp. CCMP2436]
MDSSRFQEAATRAERGGPNLIIFPSSSYSCPQRIMSSRAGWSLAWWSLHWPNHSAATSTSTTRAAPVSGSRSVISPRPNSCAHVSLIILLILILLLDWNDVRCAQLAEPVPVYEGCCSLIPPATIPNKGSLAGRTGRLNNPSSSELNKISFL